MLVEGHPSLPVVVPGRGAGANRHVVRVSDPEALQAREVVLDKIEVLDVLGDYAFLVGNEGASVPVALLGEMTRRQAEDVTRIRVGQSVRIYGVIRLLRSQQEIEDMLVVSPEVAARLRGHAVYVSALRVVLLEPSSSPIRFRCSSGR